MYAYGRRTLCCGGTANVLTPTSKNDKSRRYAKYFPWMNRERERELYFFQIKPTFFKINLRLCNFLWILFSNIVIFQQVVSDRSFFPLIFCFLFCFLLLLLLFLFLFFFVFVFVFFNFVVTFLVFLTIL